MFFPFEVADPRSNLHYRLNAERLTELSLAPRAIAWPAGSEIGRNPDPVWAASFENAPGETPAAVSAALEDLVLATPDLRPPVIAPLAEGRAHRHLTALVGLWQRMGEALPEGLAVVRHVLDLPHGQFLDPLPVVEGSLDPLAPTVLQALHDRLKAEFGSVPGKPQTTTAAEGTRLRELQQGLERADITKAPPDGSLTFYGLRDAEACAAFAAARARALIDAGCPANAIAVMTAADPRHLARAFGDQGVPLSGLPALSPERDLVGETLLHLLLAKRPPTPAMALASVALSPLMPWPGQTGRDLAETLVGGDFRGGMLATDEAHAALWTDIRMPVSGRPHLRVLLDEIIARLKRPEDLRAALAPLQPLLAGEGAPDWDALLRAVQVGGPSRSDPLRNLQGVSLWDARESPWRSCHHLIIADFTEGLYPLRPRPNPLFLDREIAAIEAALGLRLQGRAHDLGRSLALLAEQLGAVSDSVTMLVPRRDLAGARLSPAAGLALMARAVEGGDDAGALVVDLANVDPAAWPVAHHIRSALPPADPAPAVLDFGGRNLFDLRRDDAGQAKPQSPSRLETLLVSPLAWLLGELGAGDMGWSSEKLDVMVKGNIAHYVFEHVFLPGQPLPDDDTLTERTADAYETALRRYAGFLRSPSWDMERLGLEREIRIAAVRWRDHLRDLGAEILGNEVWLRGQAYGISLHGKADAILRLPDGQIAVVDHKKSSTKKRRLRMESGWDLQVGLYSEMMARPIRSDEDGMDPLIGQRVGVAYHLMNDGGFLTSGLALAAGGPARDMGNEVNDKALEWLKQRIAEIGGGRVALNTTTEAEAFDKLGVPPYALTEGSILVTGNLREDEQ